MNERELNSVRELKEKIRDLERHIAALRSSAQKLVPVLDGMPHATDVKSKVETLALQIVNSEQELETLRSEMCAAAIHLTARIQNANLKRSEKTLLILRYVVCMNFRDIAFQMDKSDATTFRLHHDAVQKMRVDDS